MAAPGVVAAGDQWGKGFKGYKEGWDEPRDQSTLFPVQVEDLSRYFGQDAQRKDTDSEGYTFPQTRVDGERTETLVRQPGIDHSAYTTPISLQTLPLLMYAKASGGFSSQKESTHLTGRLTKQKIINYLGKINEIPQQQLVKDIESIGLRYLGGNPEKGYYQFTHKTKSIRVRIDGPHLTGRYSVKSPHIHIYDKDGNSLNAQLKVVDSKSAEAHISIQEMSKILMENKK